MGSEGPSLPAALKHLHDVLFPLRCLGAKALPHGFRETVTCRERRTVSVSHTRTTRPNRKHVATILYLSDATVCAGR